MKCRIELLDIKRIKTRKRDKLGNKKVMYYKIASLFDTILNGNR